MTIFFSSITTITTLLFAFLLLRSVLRAVLSPLRNVPGPFLARFSRLWYLRQVLRGDWEKVDIELHRRYGPIVRIAPNEYSIDDVDAVKIIYGQGSKFTKSPWYIASGNPSSPPHASDLFSELSPTRHALNRRQVAQLYSVTNLLKMEPCVRECTALLTARFEEFARSGSNLQKGEVVDLQHWLQCYAFDVIGLITVARRFGFLDKGEDSYGIFAALHAYLRYCAAVGVYWELHPWLYRLLARFGASGTAYITEFARRQIVERRELMQKKNLQDDDAADDNFLSKVLAMHDEDPARFTEGHVLTTCIMNIGAGSDTTSISLSAILWYLIKTPRCLEKLRDEIAHKESTGQLSNPVTFQQSQQMPYLQAVIKEGLRMHPATGLPLGRVVPKGGETIAGRFFPEGVIFKTIVGINTWVAHRNKDIFGSDADTFRPERWLEVEDDEDEEVKARKMERYFLPLVRTFDFDLADDVDDEDDDYALQTENVCLARSYSTYGGIYHNY
ncbi:Uncharacterized protein T310_0787 [Rasamsonia emersonii CBS 393.64]|uniref:Cytochrome P450 n=1 Tax=Rasamsonia emersonii (strain ATCC 16479 / CBS 393.64 / IMI 116815) TaxID=1408163 RepID=A0A0F4Z541_RASE3|nr:Uncharacterized protein T310_0787 [Rasamsonia emersonii CBS 393.64]KKA25196.1 Uncharacterized protein T310_0787 [Rasamsonia emersonii CBS 393.64]